MTIKWNKAEWITTGSGVNRLDRKSKCGNWIIFKFDEDEDYCVQKKTNWGEGDFYEIVDFFSSLKEAKKYCEDAKFLWKYFDDELLPTIGFRGNQKIIIKGESK